MAAAAARAPEARYLRVAISTRKRARQPPPPAVGSRCATSPSRQPKPKNRRKIRFSRRRRRRTGGRRAPTSSTSAPRSTECTQTYEKRRRLSMSIRTLASEQIVAAACANELRPHDCECKRLMRVDAACCLNAFTFVRLRSTIVCTVICIQRN